MMWTEKYRPKKFNELIGQNIEELKIMIKNPNDMQHLLLVSKSPGTGKTSTAYVLKNELGINNVDFLIMNSSDERKLEHIRGKLKDFVRTARRNKNIPKLVLLDEFDGMRSDSQEALRTLMEIYSSNVRFILTANDEQSIIDPIKSRCTIFRLKELSKEDIYKRLLFICEEEKVWCNEQALVKIVDDFYPDLRSMINELQRLSLGGPITLDRVVQVNIQEDKFYEMLKIDTVYNCRKFGIETGLNPATTLKRIVENIVNDNTILQEKKNEILLFAAEINYRMSVGADKELQLFALIIKYKEVFKNEK